MLDNELKSKVNSLWDKFWSGGISNPLTAIEQISYLIFMKRLEDEDVLRQQNAKLSGQKFESLFKGHEDYKWSIWTEYSGEKMLIHVRDKVFPFLRELGGKDFRKRSSIIINNDLLIDFGPDIMSATFMHGKSIADIRYCLQTHSHSDHFDASCFTTRIPEYMGVNTTPLQLYASEATLRKMSDIEIFSVKSLQTFKFGPYQVTAFTANHDKLVDSLLYAITEGNFTVFYGTDTDLLSEEVWQGFHDNSLKFDVVILDHTYGPNTDGSDHLNANRFVDQINRMKTENLLKENARILATHISHEGNPTHNELSKYAVGYDYEIAYDGLEI